MTINSRPLPTANPQGLTVGDLVKYVSGEPILAAIGERGIVLAVRPDAREAPVTVRFENAGIRECYPVNLRLLVRERVAS